MIVCGLKNTRNDDCMPELMDGKVLFFGVARTGTEMEVWVKHAFLKMVAGYWR